MPSDDRSLWRDFVRLDADLQRAVAELNHADGAALAVLFAVRRNDAPFVDRFLARDASREVRTSLVDLVLWEAAWSSPRQRALFAALGSVGATAVRPKLTALADRVLQEDPTGFDYTSALTLLWNFRRVELVGRLLRRLLAHEEVEVRATATDFLEDHFEAQSWLAQEDIKIDVSEVLRTSDGVKVADKGLLSVWDFYCNRLASLTELMRRIRAVGSQKIADYAILKGEQPRQIGYYIANAMFGEPEQVAGLLRGRDHAFVRDVFVALQGVVVSNAEYAVNAIVDLPLAAQVLAIDLRIDAFFEEVARTYGEFDRFGWLTTPRD